MKSESMFRQSSVALIAAVLGIWAGLASAIPAAHAEVVFPPGLRVGLEPPSGLILSKTFPGFEDIDRKVAITLLDLPARTYEEIERSAFNKTQSGLADMKRESFPFVSGIGFLVRGQSSENGGAVHKWFLLASAIGKDMAVLINVAVPDSARDVYTDAVIRKALASVTFRPAPVQEQVAMLPFKLNDLAGFRVMQVLPQSGVILTDGPTDDLSRQAYMIIAVGAGAPDDAGDRGQFARDLLASAPLANLNVTVADPMRIGGLPGFEIRGKALGLSGQPVNLVQWVRFGSGGFLRVVGVAGNEAWDALFTRFRAIRDGIEFK
jgi:hypothetical protein